MKKYEIQGTIVDMNGKSVGIYKGQTIAESIGKAKSNVMYHAKRDMKLCPNACYKWYKDVQVRVLS